MEEGDGEGGEGEGRKEGMVLKEEKANGSRKVEEDKRKGKEGKCKGEKGEEDRKGMVGKEVKGTRTWKKGG